MVQDVSTLTLAVTKASPIQDHSTYKYHIAVSADGQAWEVTKRFSEFDALIQALANRRYAGLPRMPAKTLLGSPTDDVAIAARKEQLRILLQDLLARPDLRTSQELRTFLEFDTHLDDVPSPLLPQAIRTFEDPRFGVCGLSVAPLSKLLMVTHEDSTHLSRLGRVWSVVEPDELGALHMWAEVEGGSWKRLYSYTYGIKVRSLAWEETTRQCFVGLEDGKIEVYSVDAQSLKPTKKASLELHHKSPVTFLAASHRRLLSLGFDTALRTIDINSHELLCGGRLLKRLKSESDYLTCGHLDEAQERAFVGTSSGDIFILDISRNPPSFLHTLEMQGRPISMLHVSEDMLLVAHADCISMMNMVDKGHEEKMKCKIVFRSKFLQQDEVTLLSVCAAPERQWVFGGYSDGSVALWNKEECEALVVVSAHQCDVTQLAWLSDHPWGPALFSGGGDGKVTTWLLGGSPQEYALWNPNGGFFSDTSANSNDPFSLGYVERQQQGPTGASSTTGQSQQSRSRNPTDDLFAPTFDLGGGPAGGADPFRDPSVRINPQTLKSGEDSDSDNDISGAFR